MKLVPDEKTLPRLHLIGTLAIVLLLVLLLASLFVWQGWRSHRQALHDIERAVGGFLSCDWPDASGAQ